MSPSTGWGGGMKVASLGHVALRVRDLRRAEVFYAGVLGLTISGHMGEEMTFFRAGDDRFQELAVSEVAATEATPTASGLDHVAFKLAGSVDDLRAAKSQLESRGVQVIGPIDHTWSMSLYLRDPEGNGVELYVEQSDVWRSTDDFTPTSTSVDV